MPITKTLYLSDVNQCVHNTVAVRAAARDQTATSYLFELAARALAAEGVEITCPLGRFGGHGHPVLQRAQAKPDPAGVPEPLPSGAGYVPPPPGVESVDPFAVP